MKQYKKYAAPYWYAFILGPILMLVEVAGEVLMPKLLANIINVGINYQGGEATGKGISYIVSMGGGMIALALVMMVGGIGGAFFAFTAATNFANDLRKDLFFKVQSFSFANVDRFSTGSLVTRLTNDVTQLQNLIAEGLRMLLRAPGMLIGALIMAITMNARLALVVLCVIPVLVLVVGIVMKLAFPRFTGMQKQLDRVNSNIQENLTNVRVVKSFTRENYEQEGFARENSALRDRAVSAMKLMITLLPIVTFIMNFTTLSIVWFGGKQVLNTTMEVGDLTAFINYVEQILMSLMMLSMVLLNSSRAMASSDRIMEILNTEVDLTDENAKHKDLLVKEGKIEFSHVYFKYYKDNEEWVLSDLNFTVEPGQTLGIIGSTGSGKTSLVSLIPRLYDVDQGPNGEGKVLVDGVDVRDYSLKNLRSQIAMVLQKNILFSGTIEENLLWGNESASHEEVEEVAKAARAHDFIQGFPQGYDTELGQGGVNVSGGQKQRLCIARALLNQPKILILDDSTSAVDTATEARIRESFHKELAGTTKIIIAQRISSVEDADKILVLDDGKIAGIGSSQELLQTCKAYAEIYDSQIDRKKGLA